MASRSIAGAWSLLIAFAGYAASASPIHAATVTLNPAADTFVSSANAGNSYGAAGSFEVSAAGLPKGEFESLLQFDLSSAKTSFDSTFGVGDWTVQSASLQLTAASPVNSLFNASAAGTLDFSRMQNDTWVEGSGTPMAPGNDGITWNTLSNYLSAGDQSLGAFSFTGATSGNVNFSLSLPTGFLSDIESGNMKSSIRLFAGDTTVSGLFNSENFTTVASRPVLSITAAPLTTPEPASWVLGLIGIAALALNRRRLNDQSHGVRRRG